MNFSGIIIEESLTSSEVLNDLTIISTKVEPTTEKHKTPWLKQWTLHTVEIPEKSIVAVAEKIRVALDCRESGKSSWYADFKNRSTHVIIFTDKVFHVTRSNPHEYEAVVAYGLRLGIPDYQLDFSPHIKQWERDARV
jgi:hypothetical protein